MRLARRAALVLVLLSCAAGTRHVKGAHTRAPAPAEASVAGFGVDDLQHAASLFEQVGRDAAGVRGHLSEVSDRSRLFGPDIRRLERMFDGFERISDRTNRP